MIGTVFSHYRIEDRLGAGTMGVVYLGRDLTLGRLVAIKFLAAELSLDDKATARFMQEARAVSMLDHPNICAIYEIDRSAEGRVCIVMAHYGGETLDRRMAAGPLPATEAVEIAAQVVQGLECAHAQGIVHRDIKPSNIMITPSGLVKILDFGLAKLPGPSSLTGSLSSPGTPRYMSPEQVAGIAADRRADLWSVGVLLHAMVTGEVPFVADSVPALFYSILNNDPPRMDASLPGVSAELQAIVDRCLVKDPEARYPDAATLLADLRMAQRELGPGALAPPGAAGRRGTRPGIRKALRVGAVVLVLAVAGMLAWRLLGGPSEPLRVAVLPAEFVAAPDSDEVAAAAASAQVGLLRGLISLRGIAASDPSEIKAYAGAPVDLARALSVGELVSAKLEGVGGNWNVRLSRLSGADGHVLWTDNFTAPREDLQVLAGAMTARVVAGYKDHASRKGAAIPRVDKADFEELIRIRNAMVGVGPAHLSETQIHERIRALCARSPAFLDAQLLESSWARRMYVVSSDARYLREAQAAAERAREIAPWDRRAVSRLFTVALDAGRLDQADQLLAEMRRLDPGNVEILVSESELADRRGQIDHAVALIQEVVRRQPSGVYLKICANRELKHGRLQPARAHLDTLMRRYPQDPWPRSKRGELELTYGSPSLAENLYVELLRPGPNIIYLLNLGVSRAFQGHFEEAAAAYRRTLELAPNSADANINLAECELYLAKPDAATSRFRLALDLLNKSPTASGWNERIQAAHCLARLGRRQEAVAAVQEALPRSGDDLDALYTSAMVYCLVGERSSAIVNARKAIEKGLGVRWFGLPPFEPLRTDPEFIAALAAGEERAAKP